MLAAGTHGDPFRVLGLHPRPRGAGYSVRVWAPDARRVRVEAEGRAFELTNLGHGFFYGAAASLAPGLHYRLRMTDSAGERVIEDPYRFGFVISPEDAVDLKAGRCWNAHHLLGARPLTLSGIPGMAFAVWAPLALQVAVAGDWNQWDFRARPMRFRHEIGVWEFFEPHLAAGAGYCFDILTGDGRRLRRRDPMARALSAGDVAAAMVVGEAGLEPAQGSARGARRLFRRENSPLIAVIDPPGIDRMHGQDALRLVDHAVEAGFTALWLSEVMEAPTAPGKHVLPFAAMCPSAAWGGAEGISTLLHHAHGRGLDVLLDWSADTFPTDPYGLAGFDGSCLYENPGAAPAADRLRFNFARYEVANFLVCALLEAIERFGFDGIVFRQVGNILRWPLPGGEPDTAEREVDPAAVDFLRCQNEVLAMRAPGVLRIACEGIGWPGLVQPGKVGGLGFDLAGAPHWAGLAGDDTARALARAALPDARSFLVFDRNLAERDLAIALFLALPGVKALPLDLAHAPNVAAMLRSFAPAEPAAPVRIHFDAHAGPDGVIGFACGDDRLCLFNPARGACTFCWANDGTWRQVATFGASASGTAEQEDAVTIGAGNPANLPGRSLSLWQRLTADPRAGTVSATNKLVRMTDSFHA